MTNENIVTIIWYILLITAAVFMSCALGWQLGIGITLLVIVNRVL